MNLFQASFCIWAQTRIMGNGQMRMPLEKTMAMMNGFLALFLCCWEVVVFTGTLFGFQQQICMQCTRSAKSSPMNVR